MKILYRPVLSLIVLSIAFTSAFARSSCDNRTIKGTYTFTIHGQITPPVMAGPAVVLVDGIAHTTFHGDGTLEQIDAVSQNGSLPPEHIWRIGNGTYSVDSDCKGTMTINNTGAPPLELVFVIGKDGETIHTVVTNPGFSITSDAERVHPGFVRNFQH